MNRLLDRIDAWAAGHGLDGDVDPPHRFEPTRVEDSPPLGIDLRSGEIRTVIWATGFRPDYSWLNVPVLDHKGRIRHDGGIVQAPGMYLAGPSVPATAQVQPHRRRRGRCARDLSDHLVQMSRSSRRAVTCLSLQTARGADTTPRRSGPAAFPPSDKPPRAGEPSPRATSSCSPR